MDLAREVKALWNMKVTVIPTIIGALGTVLKGLVRKLEELESWKSEDESRPSKLKIGQNVKKNPGDQKRLAVT